MINTEDALKMLLERVPEFSPRWEKYLQEIQAEQAKEEEEERAVRQDYAITACTYMVEFTRHVGELIKADNFESFPRIFDFVEYLMVHGNQDVQDGVATCFLENLINTASHGKFAATSFIKFLGPESRDYCKAWDEFCGAKTEGL